MNHKGTVYITVVMIISVVLLMLGFLLSITSNDIRAAKSYADAVKAYYIAQSGVNQAMAYILDDPLHQKCSYPAPGTILNNFLASSYNIDHGVQWWYEYNSTDDTYTITSIGTYKGFADSTGIVKGRVSRKLRVLISVDGSDRITVREWKLE